MAIKKVSITAVKAIKVTELVGDALKMVQAVYVLNPTVFSGTKPVLQADFDTAITNYSDARAAHGQGGTSSKKAYDDAYDALIVVILKVGEYVDTIAVGDEIKLKLSTYPYTGQPNQSGILIQAGALPTLVAGKAGGPGLLSTTCAPWGRGVHFNAILVQGAPFPPGTIMNLNGQFQFPSGDNIPPYIININGKRAKKYTNLVPGVTYFVYYVMSFGGFVSGLSIPLKISAGS